MMSLRRSLPLPLPSPHDDPPGRSCCGAEGRLRGREEELRDVRNLHAREARDVAAELARVVEAHRAQVAALEEKLRRARRKVRAMARPKPTRRGRAPDTGGGGGVAGVAADHGVLPVHAPLSTDELLNLLAAADEGAFDAMEKTQRLEFELRSTNAQLAAALSALQDEGGAGATTGATGKSGGPADGSSSALDGEGGGGAAGDGRANAPAPWPCLAAAAAAAAAAAPDGAGATAARLGDVARAARLASAEAEVETLRGESLAAKEVAIGAQREASALRLAAHKRAADRAGEGRSREKELRRQVSAYRREAERLRSAAAAAAAPVTTVGAFSSVVGKDGRVIYKGGGGGRGGGGGGGGAGRGGGNALGAGEEGTEAARKRQARQLASAREESERRGRTIVALRAAKAASAEDLQRLRREVASQAGKLARALRDVGVKSNAATALRERVAALEAEITAQKAAAAAAATATINVATVGGHAHHDTTAPPTSGATAAAGEEPPASGCDVQPATLRDLRAERDRLRAGMRGWHASLSKKSAEISAQVAELDRLEQEAAALRAAVARKDDAYRTTKKQVRRGSCFCLPFFFVFFGRMRTLWNLL